MGPYVRKKARKVWDNGLDERQAFLGTLERLVASVIEDCARACETAGCECMSAPCAHDFQRKASAAHVRALVRN